MKSYIEKELEKLQIEHIAKEIKKTEMIIRNQYDDTLDMLTFRCNYEVALKDSETLKEKLGIYKTWYEKILYLQLKLQEEYKVLDVDFSIDSLY
jgi:hypothetical protein